jgi:hypothetical protein
MSVNVFLELKQQQKGPDIKLMETSVKQWLKKWENHYTDKRKIHPMVR